jgi:hypothetical protein
MGVLHAIAEFSLAAFGAALFAVMLAAKELGHAIGLRHRGQGEAKTASESIGFMVSGMLALLAFALGLSLSMAQSRYEDRRKTALEEANAIGTAWLRAEAIGHPRGAEIAGLLEAYTALRIDFVMAPQAAAQELAALNARTSAMQSLIWGHAAAIARERPDAVAAALQAALNDTFDLATAMRWAYAARLPQEIVGLLLALSVLSTAALGYHLGLRGRRHPVIAIMLLAMWASTITSIADLAAPRIGALRVDPAPYRWAIQGFQGGVAIPPPPQPR